MHFTRNLGGKSIGFFMMEKASLQGDVGELPPDIDNLQFLLKLHWVYTILMKITF